jgi:hypothetical protein
MDLIRSGPYHYIVILSLRLARLDEKQAVLIMGTSLACEE